MGRVKGELACRGRAVFVTLVLGCSREAPDTHPARMAGATISAKDSGEPEDTSVTGLPSDASVDASYDATHERSPVAVDGPHHRMLEEGRPIYYAFPGPSAGTATEDTGPWRLVVNLHGTCGGPEYACGSWVHAAVEVGALVCPTGNAHCGPSPLSPPTWEAPSWGELVRDMDVDLEKSVTIVQSHHPRSIRRDGAILTGYSRGGYAVPFLASMHPGRWPLLVIIEADATLDPVALRRARVRAVAMVAGAWGDQIGGMRKTIELLAAASFPARLFVMPKTGHLYSDNIEEVMREALAFLVTSESASAP
jgi:hypothetical protein